MPTWKSLSVAALTVAIAGPALADASLVDAKTKLYDADFEVIVADHGYLVGTALYGTNDADYDAYLTDAALFAPVTGASASATLQVATR